jgi:hypothetical protein
VAGGGADMSALTLVTVPLAGLFFVLGIAKVLALPFMRRAAAHAGLGIGAYRAIGVAELAAVAGLVAGLSSPALGVITVAAVLGLLVGAFLIHSRNRDPLPRWAPAIGATALAIAYGVLVSGAAP